MYRDNRWTRRTTGNNSNFTTCFCIDQMRNIIRQLITLYPEDNVIIVIESGNNVSGHPGLFTSGSDNNPTFVSLCKTEIINK